MKWWRVVVASVAVLAVFGLVVTCSEPTVTRTQLSEVVDTDAVAFDDAAIPDDVLDTLAQHRVVIIGETHLIREQRELTAAIVEGLHDRGFRTLLLEWPHLADYLADDFVTDGDLSGGWTPPTWLYGDLLGAIRDFNRTLPEADQVHVRGIDVNLDNYGGASDFLGAFRNLSRNVSPAGPFEEFFDAGYDTAEAQHAALDAMSAALDARGAELVDAWGVATYSTVVEMVEVESVSVSIRDIDPDDAATVREDEMKRLIELRLAESGDGVVINVGGNHAQKERLKGTDQEWLGDYVVHTSKATAGSVISVAVAPVRVIADYATDVADWDIFEDSPDFELFRVLAETWPDRSVFLPLTDPVFTESHVAINFEGIIHVSELSRHYDALILLPLTHRIPT